MDHLLSIDVDVVALLSKINTYEYVIVGSGFGGGPLAEVLAQRKKKVLLIERGWPIFSTHVLNTSRPYFSRGASNSPEGNESVYDAVKAKVQTTEGSEAYIGGPVYCVGGRSNLWGIWTPECSHETLDKHFPAEIATYLKEGGYDKAFNFMTDNSQTKEKYPLGSGQISAKDVDDVKEHLQSAVPGSAFDLMPVASQFISSAPYRFPQGAYSTTLALMNRMYANDPYLTVLLNTEVLSVDSDSPNSGNAKATSLLVRNTEDKSLHQLQLGNAKLILSAGTIGTATIALNSGLQHRNPLVGKGIIDHDVCYVRFNKLRSPSGMTSKPLNMKTLTHIAGEPCLLTVTVNANFFLAGSSASLPSTQYYDEDGSLLDPKASFRNIGDFDTICLLFEFVGHLDDRNEVVNLPGMDPVLRITRPALKPAVQAGMEDLTRSIRNLFVWGRVDVDRGHQAAPRPAHLGFGVFSHEAGTMRMDGPGGHAGVVGPDLRVHGFDNLWVCDLSVFPVSPEANPSLTLAALSLRLADHLAPPPPESEQPAIPPMPPIISPPPAEQVAETS